MSWSGRLPRCSANAMRCDPLPNYGNPAKIHRSTHSDARWTRTDVRIAPSPTNLLWQSVLQARAEVERLQKRKANSEDYATVQW